MMFNDIQRLNIWAKILFWCSVFLLFLSFSVYWFLDRGFPIQRVVIYGKFDRIPVSELQSQVRQWMRGNFFTSNLKIVQDGISGLPWVRQVRLYRRWPMAVVVIVKEQEPVARWQLGGFISRYGEWFNAQDTRPLVLFDGNKQVFRSVARLLVRFDSSLKMAKIHLSRVQFDPRSAWTLNLVGGHEVKLGRDDIECRLARFVSSWPTLSEDLPRGVSYTFDMRYPDGLAVGVRETL